MASMYAACPATEQAQTCQFEDGFRVSGTEWTELLNLTIGAIFQTLRLCKDEINHTSCATCGLFWFHYYARRLNCAFLEGRRIDKRSAEQILRCAQDDSATLSVTIAHTVPTVPAQKMATQVLDTLIGDSEACCLRVTSVAYEEVGLSA